MRRAPDLDTLLAAVLNAALAQASADFGTVQISEPVTGALRIAAQSGFSSEFLEYFAVVDDDGAAPGGCRRRRVPRGPVHATG